MSSSFAATRMSTQIVFIKLVSSGHNYKRVLEAAYSIYDTKTGNTMSKSFVFYHGPTHPVNKDTYAVYHSNPVDGEPSLLEQCADEETATNVYDFCEQFTADLGVIEKTSTVTFVGDHIGQTRMLLREFMFRDNAWITFNGFRPYVNFTDFGNFLQSYMGVLFQSNVDVKLPTPTFRAKVDVRNQVNYYKSLVAANVESIKMKQFDTDMKHVASGEEAGEIRMLTPDEQDTIRYHTQNKRVRFANNEGVDTPCCGLVDQCCEPECENEQCAK